MDSALSDHDDINARISPVYGGGFLPEPFTLLYASADKATPHLPIQMIRMADNMSHQVLDHIFGLNDPEAGLFDVDGDFERYREWYVPDKEGKS